MSTDDLHIAEEGLWARIDELTALLENPPAVVRPGDQFCNAYWQNRPRESPTSQAKQQAPKPIDIELTVQGRPALTGFEAQNCSGYSCTVVHPADAWKVHGPFVERGRAFLKTERMSSDALTVPC